MPRTGRVLLPNYPHHIVQRGHNRHAVFAEDADYEYYLETLGTWKAEYGILVYAYCLMTNHVHLLLQPPDKVALLGCLMKRLAGRQTRYVNRLKGRSGTLWEGRYKSSPVQTEQYFLACCRYIELNPVRAGMVARADQYRWSSYPARLMATADGGLDEHSCYRALGDTASERRDQYIKFVGLDIPDHEVGFIRSSLQRGQLTGDNRFIDQVEQMTGRRIEHRAPGNQGRPLKRGQIYSTYSTSK